MSSIKSVKGQSFLKEILTTKTKKELNNIQDKVMENNNGIIGMEQTELLLNITTQKELNKIKKYLNN